jgi:coenzyme F420-0:L-glutamate ligase/coenzyme F420-1:gamma-L-glutamate ligase
MSIELIPLPGLPGIGPGDDLGAMIAAAVERSAGGARDGDVVVVCQKIVSKAEGRIVALSDVVPRPEAEAFAREFEKDPAVVELALAEATEVLRMGDGHLITATGPGFICANSGLDRSNQNGEGQATLLPIDADKSAEDLAVSLGERLSVRPAVIISDTFGRPWRMGQLDVAIGADGLAVLDDHEGTKDWAGRTLEHTLIAVADQLAAAAGLLMGKADGVPVVLVRGFSFTAARGRAAELVRPKDQDIFR